MTARDWFRYTVIAAGAIALIIWALTSATAQDTERKCVTYENGMSNLSRMAKDNGTPIISMLLTRADTIKFHEAGVKNGLFSMPLEDFAPYRVAFIITSDDPNLVISLMYDEHGCVMQGYAKILAPALYKIFIDAFGDEMPKFMPVSLMRAI